MRMPLTKRRSRLALLRLAFRWPVDVEADHHSQLAGRRHVALGRSDDRRFARAAFAVLLAQVDLDHQDLRPGFVNPHCDVQHVTLPPTRPASGPYYTRSFTFSQSSRNALSPLSVSGCFTICSKV